MYGTFFNKTSIANNNLEKPCDLVDSGDWTVDFGIAPIPKFDNDQQDYSTTLNYKYSPYMISNGTDIPEIDAYAFEALASSGYRTIRKALAGTATEGWSSTSSSFKSVFEKQLASLINSDAFKNK